MMFKLTSAAALALTLGVAAAIPASAQTVEGQLKSDLRCLIVGLKMAGDADPQKQQSGQIATFYFFGKVDGQAPGLNLVDAVAGEATGMSEADFNTEAQRCGGELQTRGQAMMSMGQELTKRGL